MAIKYLAPTWAGRCFEISNLIVDAGILPRGSVAVYGHFLGKVHPESYFGKLRHGTPFIQHGWVNLPDGRIFDPTRWTFEKRLPYLFVGPNQGEYDEGGNEWRRAMGRPRPAWDPGEKRFHFTPEDLPTDAWGHVERLLRLDYENDEQKPGTLCYSQLAWLANAPYQSLSPHAHQIYCALEALGEGALIPIDNRRKAQRESHSPATRKGTPR